MKFTETDRPVGKELQVLRNGVGDAGNEDAVLGSNVGQPLRALIGQIGEVGLLVRDFARRDADVERNVLIEGD